MEMETKPMQMKTIDDYRIVRATRRGIPKRERSKMKRRVKISTMQALSHQPSRFSFQVRRVYRKLWHEVVEERERIKTAWSAVHATS